jgi:hypothetical protein
MVLRIEGKYQSPPQYQLGRIDPFREALELEVRSGIPDAENH